MDQGYDPARSTGNIYIAGKPSERRRQPNGKPLQSREPGEPLQPATPAPSNNTAAPQASLLPSAIRSLATTRRQVLVGNGEREGRSAGCRQLPPVQVSKPSPTPHSQPARQDVQDRDPHLSLTNYGERSQSVLRGAGDGEREEEYGDEYDLNEDQPTDLAQEDATAQDWIFGNEV